MQVARIIPYDNNIGGLTHQIEVVLELTTDYLVLVRGPCSRLGDLERCPCRATHLVIYSMPGPIEIGSDALRWSVTSSAGL